MQLGEKGPLFLAGPSFLKTTHAFGLLKVLSLTNAQFIGLQKKVIDELNSPATAPSATPAVAQT